MFVYVLNQGRHINDFIKHKTNTLLYRVKWKTSDLPFKWHSQFIVHYFFSSEETYLRFSRQKND